MLISGSRISGRYEIKSLIGQGGMADVYKAYDIILKRDVAVKILRGDLSEDDRFIRRFQREATSATSLSHQNIVSMYDVGEEEGRYYIVMEHLEGPTLKQLIKKRGQLSLIETLDIMKQLTLGIAEAHKIGIIHRDLKPQNIIILADGTVKVTDFGIAIAMNQTALTQTNSVMGSVHYLSPEQASGKQSTLQTDVYSLGIVMYEMLVGEVPFSGESPVSVALKHMKSELPSLKEKHPEVIQSVENIMIKATAKNPLNRHKDASEFHEDLLTCMNEERKNEKKLLFSYVEDDIDQTKVLPTLGTADRRRLRDAVASESPQERTKKNNHMIPILLSVFSIVTIIVLFTYFVLPSLAKVPEVTIPDVSNMTVKEAETLLLEKEFLVSLSTVEQYSEEVEEGHVISTDPSIGRKLKLGSMVTLYVSLGSEKIELEDFTGQNALFIKGKLESQGFEVDIVETPGYENYEENTVVSQDPVASTKLDEGDKIILFVPQIVEKYPDFVRENWSVDRLQTFANEYNLVLDLRYSYSDTYRVGDVMSQNRAFDTPIIKGATLIIEISLGTEES